MTQSERERSKTTPSLRESLAAATEMLREVESELEEVLEEAQSDLDRDIIVTACQSALAKLHDSSTARPERECFSSSPSLRESLAEVQHEIWSHWMTYLFSKCPFASVTEIEMEGLLIPQNLVDHWRRQMQTPYSELSEQEKESDRHQADKILAILEETE